MKTLKYILPILSIALFLPVITNAQNKITVPLSNPGEPGSLKLEVINGSITVSGYGGDEVIIIYDGEGWNEGPEVTEDGLRKISGGPGIEVTEDHNEVTISGTSLLSSSDFDIKVPVHFSLDISTVNGDVRVKDVTGELELSSVSGDVTLKNARGSAIINTVNGDITAVFNEVSENNPMAFTNLNGDIDVAFPSNAQFSLVVESEWGSVYTDFEIDMRKSPDSRSNGLFKLSSDTIYGDVNGGGPEYRFKTLNGDIYIRKK